MKKILKHLIGISLISGSFCGCSPSSMSPEDDLRKQSKSVTSTDKIMEEDGQTVEEEIFSEIEMNEISRTLGHVLVRQLKTSEDVSFNLEEVILGMQAELENKEPPLTEDQYQEKLSHLQQVAFDKKAGNNLSKAEAFLLENASNEGVVEIQQNRLQYRTVKEGSGSILAENSSPLIHYKGSFINGEVFSSSHDLQEPIVLPLKQTIPGFSLGMKGMREGEKRVLYIHPDLAYGSTGHLPPNSLLIFEIDLIKVEGNTEIQSVEELS